MLNVCKILNNSPNQERNLIDCKEYCLLLPVNNDDSSKQPLLKREKIQEIATFNELFEVMKWYMNWDEHSILINIVETCKSVKARNEIEKFRKILGLREGLHIICDVPNNVVSKEVSKFLITIDRPYYKISLKEYKEIRSFIVGVLEVNSFVMTKYAKFLCGSIHIEWLITVQAVPFMIKMAHQKRDIFIKENYVYMQIGADVIIDKV